jgi:hypothetical protein
MNARISSTLAAALVTVATLATTSTASASDKKIYPAASCQPATESLGTAYYSTTGAVYNVSATKTLTLVCPVVRDNTGDEWLAISVVARNPAEANIWCTAESRYSTTSLFKEDHRYLAVNGTTWTTLNFTAKPAPDNGFYQIICRLPKHVASYAPGIASYSVTEP